MTSYKDPDGSYEILLWEKPEWEIMTWCSDKHGQDPTRRKFITF